MKVTRTVDANLHDILKEIPQGKLAKFGVTQISANVDCEDWMLGQHVYVHNDKIWDMITDEAHGPVAEFGLHFIGYVNR